MRKVAQARATARPRQAERRERGGLSREAMLCTGGHNGPPNILRTHVRYHSLFSHQGEIYQQYRYHTYRYDRSL